MFSVVDNFFHKRKIFICLIISQLLIFLNYYFWLLSGSIDLSYIRITFTIFIFGICFYSIVEITRYEKFISIMLIFYIIMCVGSPSFHWDARSFWLFVSKQLFYDQNLNYLIENYNVIHDSNFYPILGPSLGSSIAEVFGEWNEVYPKLFSIILSIPPLIYLSFFLKNKFSICIYIAIVLFILEKSFIIGEMDGIVAVYFTLCTVLSIQLLQNQNSIKVVLFRKNLNSKLFLLFFFLNFSFLTILKVEAVVYLFIIILSFYLCTLFRNRNFLIKDFILFILSFLSFSIWVYFVYSNNVDLKSHSGVSVLIGNDFINIFIRQLFDFKNFFIISKYIYLNKPFFIAFSLSIFFLTFTYSGGKKIMNIEKDILIIVAIIMIFYIMFIYFVFLVTRADLLWQLDVSAKRVMLPLSFLISYFSLLIFQSNFKKNKF